MRNNVEDGPTKTDKAVVITTYNFQNLISRLLRYRIEQLGQKPSKTCRSKEDNNLIPTAAAAASFAALVTATATATIAAKSSGISTSLPFQNDKQITNQFLLTCNHELLLDMNMCLFGILSYCIDKMIIGP